MRGRIFLVLIHLISVGILAFLACIFFNILNKRPIYSIVPDVFIWVMIYFITLSISSGIYLFFLNKYPVFWNILSSLSIISFTYCIAEFTWGFDWEDAKTYIAFLFFAISGWFYPELFKLLNRMVQNKNLH